MEYQLGHEKHPKGFEKVNVQSLQRIVQSSKLGDRFKIDKLEPPSADLRADLVKDVNNVLRKTEGLGHQQQAQRKADEVVRYMSNLPSYLERGEKHQEKAFNVGVLEWGRLEKWQHNQRQLFRESSTYSPSTSNTSSNSSTRESSSHSSRGRTCTPGRLRTYHATAECNRRGSLSKVSPNGAKCYVKDVFTADDLVAIRNDYVKVQQSILKTHQCFNKYTEISPEESKPKHPHRQSISDRRPQNLCVAPDSKGKLKVQGGNLLEEKEKSKGSNGSPNDQHRRNTQQTVVLLRPKDKQETIHPAAAELSNSTKKHCMSSLEANQRMLFDHPESKGHKRSSNRARSCSLSRDTEWIGHPPIEQPGSTRTKEIRFPLEIKRAIVHPRGSSVSPVRSRIIEDMSNKELNHPAESATFKVGRERALVHSRSNSVGPVRYKTPEKLTKELGDSAEESKFMVARKGALVHPRLSSVSPVKSKTPEAKLNNGSIAEPVDMQKLRVGCEVDNKARNPSPFRRFSFSMGRIVKSSSSDDLSSMAQNSHHVGKLGSLGSENSIPQSNTPCEKSISNRKATVSPLRRFLDPFLKQKAGNSDHSPGSAPGPSVFRDENGNVSNRLGEAHALNSVKVKLDLGSCKEIDIDHPHDMDKRGSTTVQALLQVALKNGLPLFTFAVDNSSDILAATMTRLSSGRKDGNKWIFTFFTVHEMKKKSGSWLNYASKERKQGYIPNVVGQMKVSDVPNPDFVGKQSADSFRIREFVLLGVNLRQADEKSSDLQANDELAAIVLKLPSIKDNQRNHIVQKSSTVDSRNSSQKLGNVGGGKSSAGSENLLGLTAILPGGEHGLPCNGRPSPLIERWRFEGSCDCGGWDLGCRLRVLTSQTHITKQSSSDTALISKKIHLYSQDHELEKKPVVSLSPFKDGFYSVEFDSSLKLLQAFSICIAILNGLKPLEFFDMSSFFQKKSSEELNTRFNTEGAKHPHIIDEEEIPACFGSCPPDTLADRA